MAFKLAIDNRVSVSVKFKLKGERMGAEKTHNFTLDMDRLSQDEINEAMKSGKEIKDFLKEHTHGWTNQRLVLNDDDTPAGFSIEAFDSMLGIAGVAVFIYRTYLNEVGAQEKN